MSKNTMVELVEELNRLSDTDLKKQFIKLAEKGAYHDFRSKAACGKMLFVEHVELAKAKMIESDCKILDQLSKDIKNGEYDEPCTLEDRMILAKELNSPDCEMSQKDKDFFALGMGISKNKNQFGKTVYFASK